MTCIVRKARPEDLDKVVGLLNDAGERLEKMGLEQWGSGWMTPARMKPAVVAGECFILEDGEGVPLATVSVSPRPDTDFWTPEEQQQDALYLSKLARSDSAKGAGAWLLDWVIREAARAGWPRVRLDAWADNRALHKFYIQAGWKHLRTMRVQSRRSGALFEFETEKPMRVHTITRSARPGEAHGAGADEPVREVPGARVRGVHPFATTEHTLAFPPGNVASVWHDGEQWRVSKHGWDPGHSDYVVEWEAVEGLDPAQSYELADEGDAVVLRPAEPTHFRRSPGVEGLTDRLG